MKSKRKRESVCVCTCVRVCVHVRPRTRVYVCQGGGGGGWAELSACREIERKKLPSIAFLCACVHVPVMLIFFSYFCLFFPFCSCYVCVYFRWAISTSVTRYDFLILPVKRPPSLRKKWLIELALQAC